MRTRLRSKVFNLEKTLVLTLLWNFCSTGTELGNDLRNGFNIIRYNRSRGKGDGRMQVHF